MAGGHRAALQGLQAGCRDLVLDRLVRVLLGLLTAAVEVQGDVGGVPVVADLRRHPGRPEVQVAGHLRRRQGLQLPDDRPLEGRVVDGAVLVAVDDHRVGCPLRKRLLGDVGRAHAVRAGVLEAERCQGAEDSGTVGPGQDGEQRGQYQQGLSPAVEQTPESLKHGFSWMGAGWVLGAGWGEVAVGRGRGRSRTAGRAAAPAGSDRRRGRSDGSAPSRPGCAPGRPARRRA